ncbi:uncharacterized protein LOC111328730 [Stylophora pistillata]|uniref:uncharacterized protein LOC111328730 n=1 Tax=Stylophora pistillata TaxID=50429 RepID=UPI000C043291|nr:uncharacterized protein LOC111328730 [Stylophora pistillata]
MLREEAGDVEVYMASYSFCLRLCFLGIITFSLCSVVFIMSRGYLSFYVSRGSEIVEEESNSIERKRELPTINSYRENFSESTCKEGNFEDILLVIVFVEILYDSIPLLERLYRHRFPHIVYCGPTKPLDDPKYKMIVFPMLHGVTAYECLSTAI